MFDAAIRKVKEEVDLDISDLKIVSIGYDINEYAHFLTVGIISYKSKGIINLGNNEEHVDYDYFDFDELPENLCEPSKKL